MSHRSFTRPAVQFLSAATGRRSALAWRTPEIDSDPVKVHSGPKYAGAQAIMPWSKAFEDREAQRQSWVGVSTGPLLERMTTFRLLVHSVDSGVAASEAVKAALRPSPQRLSSLSLITEDRASLFFGQATGFVFEVPPSAIVATSPTDIASSMKAEDADEMYMRRGIHTPEALLAATEPGAWNEVLTQSAQLRPRAVFSIADASAEDRRLAAELARRASLPLVTLVPR